MTNFLKEQTFISTIIYIGNNKFNLFEVVDKIYKFLEARFEKFEIIIVNDYSLNQVKDLIKSKTWHNKVTIVSLSSKHGIESAIKVGSDLSIGDFVIEIDYPEINFDLELLYDLYKKSCQGYDIVSLEVAKQNISFSDIFYFILNKFSEIKISSKIQIAHILSRRAINAISRIKDKTRYRKILHFLSGYKKHSITIDLNQQPKSPYSIAENIKISSDILFSFTNLGIKINIYIAMIFFSFSIFLGGYTIYQYLSYSKIVEGWTTIMLFLSFGFSGIFFVLSIINKYFSILLKEIRTIPQHTITSIERL